MPAVRLIDSTDYTGGLNLRADAFQIGESESPSMLNIEVDPRGGFRTRRAWEDWELVPEAGTWDPRSMYSHIMGSGVEVLFLTNDTNLWVREEGGGFTEEVGVVASGDPHCADFASWGDDVYIACGRGNVSRRWSDGSGAVALTDPSVGSMWSNDPLAPVGNTMPKAEFTCAHNGYLWVANTVEDGVTYTNRVRFSLPNDPDSWAELDFVQIPEGGGPITGIAPLRDQLLVFTARSVYAIYGYDLSSFGRMDVIRTVGAVNRQCIARSETAVYFASYPEGVHRITADGVDEVSVSLRPAIVSNDFSPNTDLQFLGWAGQRLYWSVPYDPAGAPIGTRTVFVFDPSLESWTMHRSGCGCAVSPVINSLSAHGPIAATRYGPSVLSLNGSETTGVDTVTGVEFNMESYYRTRWFHENLPTIKKRWRRPDIVADESETDYSITMYVFHDFDEANARRTQTISVTADGSGGLWFEDPEWDGTDESLETPPPGAPIWSEVPDPDEAGWGVAPAGSTIERGSSLGSASAIQLEFRGEPGRSWGINALVLKYVLRRIR